MKSAPNSIKEKIAALRAKTTAAGCTEAEALAAAELAAALMSKHGLDEADLAMTEATASEKATRPTWRSRLVAVIAYCTNTAGIIILTPAGTNQIKFVGRAPGPEIAVYLRTVCFRAIDAEVRRFKTSTFYRRRRTLATKRQAVQDFIDGLVSRLNKRLVELFAPVRDEEAWDEARQALARLHPNRVSHAAKPRKVRFSDAADEGWAAGGDVALNRGVATEPERKALA